MLSTPPPYETAFKNDSAFIEAFESRTLPFTEWVHAAHIRMAWIYLTGHGFEGALSRAREGIKAYNKVNNVVDAPLSGYHETITQAWLRVVHATIRGQDPSASSLEFLEAQPHLRVRTLLRVFYSKARILLPEAKTKFVPPDLGALP
ncbi:MAG TPA: hypothetical protein VJS20_11015 [Gemmatimonadales bacterium]|nr:hypothetical protein [Gemmatimonadales bacterium]